MLPTATQRARIHRRQCLALASAGVATLAGWPLPSPATPEETARAIAALTNGAAPRPGRVSVVMPKLAENGLTVPLTVSVDSPMTERDHVRTVHVFAQLNPSPTVARFHFGPRSGEAFVRTRIRLADSQDVVALAEMSDGSVWIGQTHVVVTLGGCIDPIL